MGTTVRQNRLTEADDRHLLEHISQGRTQALSELYDRYSHRAYRVAISICRDDKLAQDAVQQAFLSVWTHRTSCPSCQGSVAAWLLISVRRSAIDIARRLGSDQQRLDHHSDSCPAPDPVDPNDPEQLLDMLVSLPEAHQEVITLAYYGQLTHRDIAAELGLPTDTVKGRMRLGLQHLQKRLEQSST